MLNEQAMCEKNNIFNFLRCCFNFWTEPFATSGPGSCSCCCCCDGFEGCCDGGGLCCECTCDGCCDGCDGCCDGCGECFS